MPKSEEVHWNLDNIVLLDKFDSLYAEVELALPRYDEFYKTMAPDMSEQSFKKIIDFDEDLSSKLRRLYDRASLMESADQKSAKAKRLKSRVDDLLVKYEDSSRKILHWMKGKEIEDKVILDNENAKRLFNAVPDLTYILKRMREEAKYTLSQPEESIINKKDTVGVEVLQDLRTLIQTEFTYFFKPRGAKRGRTIKTLSDLQKYVYSKQPCKREASYMAMLTKHKENIDKLFIIYQAVVKDWGYETRLRGYASPISVRNFSNHIPDKTVEILLEVCRDNREVFQRYFRWKAQQLNMKKLRRFDIYAPLPEAKEEYILYNKALTIVLDTFEKFSAGFVQRARQILDTKHIDSHPRPEKEGGAFCATVSPNIIPYVFTNYVGKRSDVLSLAHELGHGTHSLYASHHSISSQQPNPPLAETASTLSEMIVFERLCEEADKNVRRCMLSERIAEAFNTILRQNYFVIFEQKAHEAIAKGITAEELSDIYFNTLKEEFGDSVELNPLFRYEWALIPHIVNSPFYCYSYSFGNLLSLALFRVYKNQGNSFVPEIEKILAYGGSKNPQEVLQEVNVNMCSREFWQGSFNIIDGWMKQLEKHQTP